MKHRNTLHRKAIAVASTAALVLGSLTLVGCGNDDDMPPMEEPTMEEPPMDQDPGFDEPDEDPVTEDPDEEEDNEVDENEES
jgi:hypothetical protein